MWHCDIVTCTDTQTPLGIATTSNRLKHATFDSLLSPLSVTPIQKATFGAFKQHRIQTDCHITSRIGILKSREAHALSRNRQLPTVQPSRRKQRTSKKKKHGKGIRKMLCWINRIRMDSYFKLSFTQLLLLRLRREKRAECIWNKSRATGAVVISVSDALF